MVPNSGVLLVVLGVLGADGGADLRDSLRGKIDLSGSGWRLAPEGPTTIWGLLPPCSVEPLVQTLETLTGTYRLGEPQVVGSTILAETQLQTIEVGQGCRSYVVQDLRGLAPMGTTHADEAAEIQQVEALLEGMGATASEAVYAVRDLGRWTSGFSDSADSDTMKGQRIATKVVVTRNVGGIMVAGDKLVVTFTIDGGFRALVGTWTPIDYGGSQLASTLTDLQFVERALDYLMTVPGAADSPASIRLGTYYRSRRTADNTYVLDLVGFAAVTSEGPHGSRKVTVHEFAI